MDHKDFTAMRRIGAFRESTTFGGTRCLEGRINRRRFWLVNKGGGKWQLTASGSEVSASDRRSIDPAIPIPDSERDGELVEDRTTAGDPCFRGRFMGREVVLHHPVKDGKVQRNAWHLVE